MDIEKRIIDLEEKVQILLKVNDLFTSQIETVVNQHAEALKQLQDNQNKLILLLSQNNISQEGVN